MSASDLFQGAMPDPLFSSDGGADYGNIPPHLNAAFTAVPHGLPDSEVPAGGPTPGSYSAGGAPAVSYPVG